jgi:hypothetical protein
MGRIRSCIRRIPSRIGSITSRRGHWRREGLFWTSDPSCQVSDAHESTGEEEAKNGEDADDRHIPAVGLSKSDADTGNGAALVRTVERAAGHGVRDRQDRAAV